MSSCASDLQLTQFSLPYGKLRGATIQANYHFIAYIGIRIAKVFQSAKMDRNLSLELVQALRTA